MKIKPSDLGGKHRHVPEIKHVFSRRAQKEAEEAERKARGEGEDDDAAGGDIFEAEHDADLLF